MSDIDIIRYRCVRCRTASASCERCPKCQRMLCATCRMPFYDGTQRGHGCVVEDGKESSDGK